VFGKLAKNPAHQLGIDGEKKARKHLKKKGYRILEANYRTRLGELDLIATVEEYLVFVEVKTRIDQNPFIQMTQAKIKKIRTLALAYMAEKEIQDLQPRFDVIGITKHGTELTLEHLENAF